MTNVDPVVFAKVMADETRQQIMSFCCCRWCSVSEITESVKVSQPTVSHHLAILRDAGLVDICSEGKQTFYTLNQERVAFCCGQLMLNFAPETKTTDALKKLARVG